MGEIKSAFEIAMEKAEKLGNLMPGELRRLESIPKGNALGARFLRGEISLEAEISQYDKDEAAFIKEGILEALLRNITLPHHEQSRKTSKKALDGILFLKKEKDKLKPVVTEIEHLSTYYEQSLRQLQMKFKEKLESNKAPRTTEGFRGPGARSEMEKQMALQEEWRMALAELNSQYQRALEEHKTKIGKLS